MKTTLHKSETRGQANHGWLNSNHSFSFANYFDPERMNFGVLRVLNDDVVAPGRGFDTHPHRNMEIISIPLEGDLQHRDDMGNVTVIRQGDIQVMSAGTGVRHSEYNKNQDAPVKFLQIWVIPNAKDVTPRYDQISLEDIASPNQFYQILSPDPEGQGVWIHQDAWFHLGEFEPGQTADYSLKKQGNGVYVFVIEGSIAIDGQPLERRDGYGVWEIQGLQLEARKSSKVLLMEVPLE